MRLTCLRSHATQSGGLACNVWPSDIYNSLLAVLQEMLES